MPFPVPAALHYLYHTYLICALFSTYLPTYCVTAPTFTLPSVMYLCTLLSGFPIRIPVLYRACYIPAGILPGLNCCPLPVLCLPSISLAIHTTRALLLHAFPLLRRHPSTLLPNHATPPLVTIHTYTGNPLLPTFYTHHVTYVCIQLVERSYLLPGSFVLLPATIPVCHHLLPAIPPAVPFPYHILYARACCSVITCTLM